MKTSDDLIFLRTQLAKWASPFSGTVEIASDIVHLFALLSIKPGGFRIAVKWKGEDKRGEYEEAGMVDARYWVCLSFGNSMLLNKGSALAEPSGGGDPWADTVEACRDFIRGLQFDPASTEAGPNYLGVHELIDISPEFLVDGYYLEFLIGKLLPAAQPGAVQTPQIE